MRIGRLKATLARGPLPAGETAKYLAAQGALMSLVFIPTPAEMPADWTFLAYPLLAAAGVYYCYRSNGGALGERFAERYVAIGWVVGWRVALVLIAAFGFGLLSVVLRGDDPGWLDNPHVADAVNIGGFAVVGFIYWRMAVHLATVRRMSG